MCKFLNCRIGSSYGIVGLKPSHCSTHKTEDMINLKHARCELCNRQASYGYRKDNIRLRCRQHTYDPLEYLKLYKCVVPQCDRRIKKNKTGLCSKCFILGNRTSFESIYYDSQTERDVAFFLTDSFPNHYLYWNRKITDYDCKYRPDFMYDLPDYSILIEVDQHKHVGYTHENERIESIQQHIGKPIHVIRWNPDDTSTTFKFKLDVLKIDIDRCLTNIPIDMVSVSYLFY